MTKDQSLQLKGIAILMMLFLHLFNTQERMMDCVTYLDFFNGKPLVYALARTCGLCVLCARGNITNHSNNSKKNT